MSNGEKTFDRRTVFEMKIYYVSFTYKSVIECGQAIGEELYMESIRRVELSNDADALKAINTVDREYEHSYKNSDGNMLKWTLCATNVQEYFPIDGEKNIEVFSRFYGASAFFDISKSDNKT